MENSELAKRELGGQSFIERLIEKTDSLEQVKEVGMVIIKSGFCPEHFCQSQDAVGAIMCIEAGRKLGLSWMQSLSDIYPVKGRIGIMGTAAKAVIFASGILESWTETTEGEYPQPGYKHITISKRKDLPNEFRTEFSVFDASTAGLMQKDIYKKYGKRMIAWRDIGFHASDYYQDILKGMKTVEELNDYDGLVPGTPEKVTLKTKDGKEVTFTDKDKEHSIKMTSKVADKIPDNKFGEVKKDDIQDATIVEENKQNPRTSFKEAMEAINTTGNDKDESSITPQRGSVETLDGKEIDRENDIAPAEDGKLTLEGMEKMDTADLLKIINEDMDMMEGMEMIGGKNTNKKLRLIIFAHQNDTLAEYVAENMPVNTDDAEGDGSETKQGDIAINKDFDNQGSQPAGKPTGNADILQPDKKPGNKYELEVPEMGENGNRDFSSTKTLFNALAGVSPSITASRYLELAAKLGIAEKYLDKEVFCRGASVELINQLLNAN